LSLLERLRFSRVNSPIHEIDPRVKFLLTMVIFVSAILFTRLLPLLFILLIQVPIVFIGKIQREWAQSLKGGLFLAIIILTTNLVSLYYFNNRTLTTENLEYGLAITVRFLVLITSFSIFFLTTSPDKLSLALEKARIPFEFNFAFITAIRFVPVLADEAQSIIDAQRSRGLELDKGNLFGRIKNYIPILLPLIINSIRRSLELAEAMESRAFGATRKRTNLYELKMIGKDYAALGIVLLALALALYIKYVFPPLGPLFPPSTII
tara:strand:- start:3050 stop:3844 length:795 start_codon:yes stop_codon:yes gene_type:complete